MDYKLELVAVPVSDVDRAKEFYVEQAGFNPDHDHAVSNEIRFVQLTPPGSGCSIATFRRVSGQPPPRASAPDDSLPLPAFHTCPALHPGRSARYTFRPGPDQTVLA